MCRSDSHTCTGSPGAVAIDEQFSWAMISFCCWVCRGHSKTLACRGSFHRHPTNVAITTKVSILKFGGFSRQVTDIDPNYLESDHTDFSPNPNPKWILLTNVQLNWFPKNKQRPNAEPMFPRQMFRRDYCSSGRTPLVNLGIDEPTCRPLSSCLPNLLSTLFGLIGV